MTAFCFESINWSPTYAPELVDPHRLVAAAADAGFEWMTLHDALLDAAREADGSLDALARDIRDRGLRVLAIQSLSIGENAAAAVERAGPLVDASAELGAPYLQSILTAALGDAALGAVRRASERAAASDVALAFEFLPFLPVARIADARRVVAACEDPRAGIVVDSWHFFHGRDGWPELASLSADEIAFVQFDDHPALASDDLMRETLARRVLPGHGRFDVARFAATLRGCGYEGPVALELLSEETRALPPEAVAGPLLRAAEPYWRSQAAAGRPFANLDTADHVSLATRRRNGEMVRTPLWFSVIDDRVYLRTIADSGKVKRIRNDSVAELAPCTATGEITGPVAFGSACMLEDADRIAAADRALDERYGEQRREMTRLMAEQGQELAYIEVRPV